MVCRLHIQPHKARCEKVGLPWWLRWERICLQCRRPGFDSWVGRSPGGIWRQPTPVFLLGESHEQRSLVGYSSWDREELDTTEWLSIWKGGCGAEGQRLPNLEVVTWVCGVSLLKDEQTVNGPKTWKFAWCWTSLRSSYFTVPTSLGRADSVSGRLYEVWPSNKGMA